MGELPEGYEEFLDYEFLLHDPIRLHGDRPPPRRRRGRHPLLQTLLDYEDAEKEKLETTLRERDIEIEDLKRKLRELREKNESELEQNVARWAQSVSRLEEAVRVDRTVRSEGASGTTCNTVTFERVTQRIRMVTKGRPIHRAVCSQLNHALHAVSAGSAGSSSSASCRSVGILVSADDKTMPASRRRWTKLRDPMKVIKKKGLNLP